MMGPEEARAEMLANIRDAVRRSPLGQAGEDGGASVPGEEGDPAPGSTAGVPGPIPARAKVTGEARVELFVREARAVDTTVERLDALVDVPESVATYLDEVGLAAALSVRDDLRSLDWEGAGVRPGGNPADDEGPAVLLAFAGVAETGSLCLTSNEAPLREAFLPDTLVVVLREADLLGAYEELWERGREAWGRELPSSLVFVAGPSRTADIQQTLILGAHGPRRLHVLLVKGSDG